MTVSCQGVRGGRAAPPLKAGAAPPQRAGAAPPTKGGAARRAAAEARANLADDQLGVRIEQQLRCIEAMAAVGGAVDAIGVELPGTRVRKIAMPDEIGALVQLD